MKRKSITRALPSLAILVIALAMSLEGAQAALQVKRVSTVYVEDWNTGTPVAGAAVYLDDLLVGTTDSSGRCVIGAVSTDSHHVSVSKEGYTEYETTIDINGNSTVILRITSIMTPPSTNVTYKVFIDMADGNATKAMNSLTGNVEYAGTDAAAVVQSVINHLAGTGGLIELAPGIYVWETVPAFPRDLPSWLKIVGDEGAVIRLTLSGPRAFDFDKEADYDTFRNIWIENLFIDCNNVGGWNHVVLGTLRNGVSQSRINIENLMIRNVTTMNVPVDPTLTNHRLNIHLQVRHDAPGEKQTHIENVWVENCDLRGGNEGVSIAGQGGPSVTGLNIFIDNVHILNCRHSLIAPQAKNFPSANFQIGNRGYGGYGEIANCYGEFSGDVGVEVDAMTNVLVKNVTIVDAVNEAFYHTNMNNPGNPNVQTIVFKNCVSEKAGLSDSSVYGRGFLIGSSLSVPIGTVILEGCAFYSSAGSYLTYPSKLGDALIVNPSSGMTELSVSKFKAVVEGVAKTTPSSSALNVIYIEPTGTTTTVSLTDVDVLVRGSRNAGNLVVRALFLSGLVALNLDNMTVDIKIAGSSENGLIGIDAGVDPSTIDGMISRFRAIQLSDDNNPRPIVVEGTSTLTIKDRLSVEYSDFSAMPAGVNVFFAAGDQNKDNVYLYNNT
jgi:hypothetical protein